MPASSLRLISRIVKKEIPSEIIKNLNKEYIHHKVINFLIDDICAGSFSLNDRYSIGRTDSAFYIEKLPAELQTYAKGLNQSTISSSKLLLNIFSEDFSANEGWVSAKNLYANFIFREKSREGISIGENDADIKDAERDRLKIFAGLITKTIFGSPVKIKNSPLPKALVKSLIYADQRFHEKLLNHESTQNWTIEQIRDARVSLLKLLCVTRLLMPMLTALADKKPSQQEIWVLGLILSTLLKSASALSQEILIESFSGADSDFQKRVQEKEKLERIQNRTKTFKTRKPTHHVRSRSADTTPIDLKLLISPQEARKKRELEKTRKAVADLEFDDDAFSNILNEGKKALEENDQIRQAQTNINDFSIDDIEQIEKMLADQLEQELISLIPDGEFIPDRHETLPESTADSITPINSTVNPATPTAKKTAETNDI